ncbi:hypothetical protein CYY_001261 [Polysphondylium violaceum]|uniref:MRN complex-interacting protein N-terminal domain-containing protein n=1 Tax=Polysphondylium violaceum TaxID=133409 RepID=A0A8J4Q3D7_9MYCE|nr:hypothetical protein CYY_001261 [Polysphondylium violaceum]
MVEYILVKCFSCTTFQVQQKNKKNSFSCKMCGAKQTVQKVYGISNTAKPLSELVKKYNMDQGMRNESSTCTTTTQNNEQDEDGFDFDYDDGDDNNNNNDSNFSTRTQPKESKWKEFEEEKRVDEDDDEDDNNNNSVLNSKYKNKDNKNLIVIPQLKKQAATSQSNNYNKRYRDDSNSHVDYNKKYKSVTNNNNNYKQIENNNIKPSPSLSKPSIAVQKPVNSINYQPPQLKAKPSLSTTSLSNNSTTTNTTIHSNIPTKPISTPNINNNNTPLNTNTPTIINNSNSGNNNIKNNIIKPATTASKWSQFEDSDKESSSSEED